MKYLFILFLSMTIIGCSSSDNENSESTDVTVESPEIEVDEACSPSAPFGSVDICLPTIPGMTECYSHPLVKRLADHFEAEGNTVLAYYVSDSAYAMVDRLDEIAYDDYFKFYVTDEAQGISVGQAELNELAGMMSENSFKETWEEIGDEIKEDHNFNIGQPTVIEEYSPNPDVRTFIMLVNYQQGSESTNVVMSMNMMEVKNRLVWMAYYKYFNGEESIKATKSKNDEIVNALLAINN